VTMASPLAVRVRRDQRRVLGAAAFASAAAWLALLSMPMRAHGHATPVAVAFLMWTVMTVAMMLPPVMPWLAFFTRTRADRSGEGAMYPTGIFLGGYLAVWTVFALAAAVVQVGLVNVGVLAGMDPSLDARFGGAVLVAAGLFQFTPLKAACLAHCRTPLGFFLSKWRDGPRGAFTMGLEHGRYCLGCCWALMLVAFALGVMNLAWMAVLTLGLSVEKIAPRGAAVGRAFGVLLAAWGAWMLLGR
jgi:predicted metal-binding membrane protein